MRKEGIWYRPAPGAPDVLLERRAAVSLGRLMDELDAWGSIVPVSGWRSREEQERLYAQSLRENGEEFTRQFVARPAAASMRPAWPSIWPWQGKSRTLSARPFPTGASAGGSGSGAPILDLSCATRRGRKRSPALPMNPGIFVMLGFHMPKSWCKIIWSLKNIFRLSNSIVMDNPLTLSFGVGRRCWFRICRPVKALIPA